MIDGDRLLRRIDELGRIGATSGGGVSRAAYGPEDLAARDAVSTWMVDAGLDPTVDAAANLVGASRGVGRRLVTGSHIDTVPEGGRLDGAYGVLAGIEAADAFRRFDVHLRHPLSVVAFSNEEGANGTQGMVGSHAVAGMLTAGELEARDDAGRTLAAAILAAGGAPAELASAAWSADTTAAFVELHIEQGPILDGLGARIGVVEAITGRAGIEIRLTGAANHAGTTPMDRRRDALTAGAEAVLAVRALATEGLVRVATCGHIRAHPNVRNVIPGQVLLGVEVRDTDAERMDAALAELATRLQAMSTSGVDVEIREGQRVRPVACAPSLMECVVEAADSLGLARAHLPSGAGHDAQVVSAVCPVTMVFVPSAAGVSHAPDEDTLPSDLVEGANVLLRTLLLADGRLP
jgi:N-carbamoyl-L-amino-acid hydrolase